MDYIQFVVWMLHSDTTQKSAKNQIEIKHIYIGLMCLNPTDFTIAAITAILFIVYAKVFLSP